MANNNEYSKVQEILTALEVRQSQIHSRAVNLNSFRVIDNRHFQVDGIDLIVDPDDDLPVRQLCSNIGMSLGFYKANPGALNQTIFDTRLRDVADRPAGEGEKRRDSGERMIRYRTQENGAHRLLAILPMAHQVVPYVEAARAVVEALPEQAVVRLSNHDRVDDEHRFTLRASFPQYRFNAADHDPIEMGLFLDLSEDGIGKYTMTSMLHRLVCSNGAMTTFDEHPYFEYNYRGIRAVDLGAAMQSAMNRFGDDLAFVHNRCLESTKALMTNEEADSFLKQLEEYRNVSAGFLRKVRKELTAKGLPHISRWDVVNQITAQAQELPHAGRVQHEFFAGGLLGLNLSQTQA